MKCPSDTSMHRDITERKSDNIFFGTCGQYNEPVEFVSIETL